MARAPGGRGILTVYSESKDLAQDGTNDGSGTTPNGQQSGTSQIEIEWVRIDNPTQDHPKFAALTSEQKKLARDLANKFSGTLATPIELQDAPEAMLKLFYLLAEGIQSYMSFAPIVRRTTPHSGPPP